MNRSQSTATRLKKGVVKKKQAYNIEATTWQRRRRRQGVRPRKPFSIKRLMGQAWRYTRFTLSILTIIGVCLSPYLIWQYLEMNNVFPIKKVAIHSDAKYIVGQRKDNLINELLGQNFVSYDFKQFRVELLQSPWIKTARVDRRWPDEVDLIIVERRPVAMWNDLYLIEADGTIFEPDLMPDVSMVNLIGNSDQTEKLLDGMKIIQKAMHRIDLKAAKIILDYRGAWTIVLENDVELYLGVKFFEERLERFISHYPSSIRAKMNSITAIDFRYDRGYALKWKR